MAAHKKDVSYNTLYNEIPLSLPRVPEQAEEEEEKSPASNPHDVDHEDVTGVIIHKVPENNRGGWTHIEDLDTFYTRMYRYYLKGGFSAMLVSDVLQLSQYCFIVFFLTFLVHCVNYPLLFREGNISNANINNVTFSDIIYPQCSQRVSFRWWLLIVLCAIVGFVKLTRSAYHLYHAYETKLFFNNGLKINDEDLGWLSWCSVQSRVREAQRELQMCIHKQQITELDIYHRILRFDNYLVAMVNKRLLPLYVNIPHICEFPYLSKGLKYNLELLLFYNPWSPWENCWQLRECYKDASQRLILAKQLENHIFFLAILNLILAPLIQAWQILYFFFSYAELIRRSPESLGLRTWSVYARILLRHFNELDHELSDRLNRAHKPATKYLTSFPSPITTIVAKNTAFLCASVLGVIIILSVYDEIVLTVEHMLTLITGLGCLLAVARSFIPDESVRQRSSEELLVQVLGHVHYLPASWRGKAHTKNVATHFQQLFQFRALYILIELLSPILCPLILYSLRSRAIDIVDFYRNFTVSVLDIGDVCSFAQMDVRRHGNPEWPAEKDIETKDNVSQYYQGEDGKTELSLIAFSCRNPGWRVPNPAQRQFLQTLHNSVLNTTNTYNPFGYQNNLSYYQRTNPISNMMRSNVLSNLYSESEEHTDNQNRPKTTSFSQSHVQDQEQATSSRWSENKNFAPQDKAESLIQEEQDLSISALHLYDIHLARCGGRRSMRQNVSYVEEVPHSSGTFQRPSSAQFAHSKEDTPLLKKTHP